MATAKRSAKRSKASDAGATTVRDHIMDLTAPYHLFKKDEEETRFWHLAYVGFSGGKHRYLLHRGVLGKAGKSVERSLNPREGVTAMRERLAAGVLEDGYTERSPSDVLVLSVLFKNPDDDTRDRLAELPARWTAELERHGLGRVTKREFPPEGVSLRCEVYELSLAETLLKTLVEREKLPAPVFLHLR